MRAPVPSRSFEILSKALLPLPATLGRVLRVDQQDRLKDLHDHPALVARF